MTTVVIFILVILASIVIVEVLRKKKEGLAKYHYGRKDFFMSRAEHGCYDALLAAVGDKYHIFPQVHLPSVVNCRMHGQKGNGAFWHVSQKSLDFVLCDKAYISPKLAIELDDRTHEQPKRHERDIEVERILKESGLPLLRLENHGHFNPHELAERITAILK